MEKEDDEWEEEETLLVVELSGILDSNFIKEGKKECNVLGIDSERPFLQLGDYTFSGEYADTNGSHLIFQETRQPGSEKPELKYMFQVDKCLQMSRVFLGPKSPEKDITSNVDFNVRDQDNKESVGKEANVKETTPEETAIEEKSEEHDGS